MSGASWFIDRSRWIVEVGSVVDEGLREQVRVRYAAAAVAVGQGSGGGCGPTAAEVEAAGVEAVGVEAVGVGAAEAGAGQTGGSCCGPATGVSVEAGFGAGLYAAEDRDGLPADALAASLGCGNPLAVAELRAGERVLDLGSGGGIDVLLSARRVGESGRAFGLDMTDEMLALARANAAAAGASNVEFLKGTIEAIPLPAGSVDVVISNCVINLSVDKPAVFAEMFRVLAPGGRIGVTDVVAEDGLTSAQRADRGSYVGCIAGALSRSEYLAGLAAAGFTDATVTFTHEAAQGMHSAIVRATKPATAAPPTGAAAVPDAAAASPTAGCC
jgi:SAM-dependent methyltransferase